MPNMSPYLTQYYSHECRRSSTVTVSPTCTQMRSMLLEQLHKAMLKNVLSKRTKPMLIRECIWDFMCTHGIEFTDTNWRSIDKAYYRYRKALAEQRQLLIEFPVA